MRTTIRLGEALLRDAERRALETNRTLTAAIEDALRESLSRKDTTPKKPVRLPTWGRGGIKPSVDLDDSAALLDTMEDRG